jgi:DNA-binding winged helix-turn-helix (wHTH) protein
MTNLFATVRRLFATVRRLFATVRRIGLALTNNRDIISHTHQRSQELNFVSYQ